jgi:hypothetical protein
MEQYTENYERAVNSDDMKGAYAWSARRVDLLEKMLRVTGLYDKSKEEMVRGEVIKSVSEEAEAVHQMPDEELERRTIDILAKRGYAIVRSDGVRAI